jgi:hypothetical protein
MSSQEQRIRFPPKPTQNTVPHEYGDFRGDDSAKDSLGDWLANRAASGYHHGEAQPRERKVALRKFIIERDIPAAGSLDREQLRGAAAKSNGVLRQLGPDIQGVESFVAADKTFCVYLAKDEDIIKKHAEISGFPATTITEVRKMIDPTTEHGD